MHWSHIFICLASFIWHFTDGGELADWDFRIIRFEYNTSNPDLASFNIRTMRTTGGVYALNGTFYLGVDMDDAFWGSVKVHRSAQGNSDFRETPFEVEVAPFFNFMSFVYVKVLQKTFSTCSNMPQFASVFDKPLSIGTYYLKKCRMTNEELPGHVQPGIYRITVKIKGKDLELALAIFLDVKTKGNFYKR